MYLNFIAIRAPINRLHKIPLGFASFYCTGVVGLSSSEICDNAEEQLLQVFSFFPMDS